MSQKLNTFQRVRELEGWQAVAFAATLVERMLPNYILFCNVSSTEGAEQLRKTLNVVWEWLVQPKSKVNWAVQLEKVEDLTPDASEFDGYGVYPAIDAAISLSALIMLITQEDPHGAVVVSKLSQGSVEAFVEATSETELDRQAIKQHPLMQWEVGFQQMLLDELTNKPGRAECITLFRNLAVQDGISNIGIERE